MKILCESWEESWKRKKGRKPSQDEEEAPHHLEFKKISLCLFFLLHPLFLSVRLWFFSSSFALCDLLCSLPCSIHTLAPFSSCINLYHPPNFDLGIDSFIPTGMSICLPFDLQEVPNRFPKDESLHLEIEILVDSSMLSFSILDS